MAMRDRTADRDARRLAVLRDWIERAAVEVDASLSVRLWNGERVPLGCEPGPVTLAVNGRTWCGGSCDARTC